MNGKAAIRSTLLTLGLALLSGCGGSRSGPAPLPPGNVNLVFVVAPDLAWHLPGDVDPDTANLTDQGLHRSLLMAGWLRREVLGGHDASGIYALAPMTHPQTPAQYPDMASLGFIQPFALLNRLTLPLDTAGSTWTANSFPINVAYRPGSVPAGVAAPQAYSPGCAGLAFGDPQGGNGALASGIIAKGRPGYHVFSAPWETVSALLAEVARARSYDFRLPTAFQGSNRVFAISVAPAGDASLLAYDGDLRPDAGYPAPPVPVPLVAVTSTQQPPFGTTRTGGVDGATLPPGINTNETVHFIRHAEAHPDPLFRFEDGNIVGAGQWRALALAGALRGRIRPDEVYAPDPAQWYPTGVLDVSYVRPALTVLPYAVANNLPYRLVAGFSIMDPAEPQLASDFFFKGGRFSNRTVLVAWESSRIKPLINALLASYGAAGPLAPAAWPSLDYDTIWTVKLDAQGNVSVDDALSEGIESSQLPEAPPAF